MSKVIYDDPVKALKGRICTHTDVIYKEMYGTKFTSKICNPRDLSELPFSDEELQRQSKFKTAHQNALDIRKDSEKFKAARKRFVEQKRKGGKYKTVLGMLIAEEYSKL